MTNPPKVPTPEANMRFDIDDLLALDDATLLEAVAEAHPVDTILLCCASGGRPLADRLRGLCPDPMRQVLAESIEGALVTEPLVAMPLLANFQSIVQKLQQRPEPPYTRSRSR